MKFFLVFVPLLVAMDAIGLIPFYLTLAQGMMPQERRKFTIQAMMTAIGISVTFIVIGKALFSLLGITIPDFQIAGGLVLLVIAILDILHGTTRLPVEKSPTLGIVPLGTPLIIGPAVLTTLLLLIDLHGLYYTFLGLATNLFIVWLALIYSGNVMKVIGAGGIQAISRITDLLLAAIAVMLMRTGIVTILK